MLKKIKSCRKSLLVRTLRSDDGNGNEYLKKALTKKQICKSITLFLYISLSSLYDYDVKMLHFTLREVQATTKFPLASFPLSLSDLHIVLRN